MNDEELQNQFEELYKKSWKDNDRQLEQTAFKRMLEAKRLAKSHRLLIPYIWACISITDFAQELFELEIGADNALEMIALLENEEKARKFQDNFDWDEYQYVVYRFLSCAYHSLATHTALQYGFNSQIVHGAIDDGFQVCRRTGNLESIHWFRDYATVICFASADYEMGEYYTRTNIRQNIEHRLCDHFRNLFDLCFLQGKFNAAWEVLMSAIPVIETSHEPMKLGHQIANRAECLCILTGRKSELPSLLKRMNFADGMPEIPTRDEQPARHLDRLYNDTLKLILRQKFEEAENLFAEEERFLLARENLKDWFDIRVRRIAARLMSNESGNEPKNDFDSLTLELRQRASKACQWSAILSLDAMLNRSVRLNPMGIPFPIDIGLYATAGTPLSGAQLELTLPLIEKPQERPEPKKEESEKSPLELEAGSWLAVLQPLWDEFFAHLDSESSEPFPKAKELAAAEQNTLEKILQFTPESSMSEEEFLAVARPLYRMQYLKEPEQIKTVWNWFDRFRRYFTDCGRIISAWTYCAFCFRECLQTSGNDPDTIGLPNDTELEQQITKAFELEPNRTNIAETAGMIFKSHGNLREAQRYFARACQLNRLAEYATVQLSQLYERAERPKDALATIDLYLHAGGRHPGLLWQAMQISYRNDMPREFLLYYKTYTAEQTTNSMLEGQRIWAFAVQEQWNNVLNALNPLDELLSVHGRDQLFLRALCQAELGDASWTDTFDNALNTEETGVEGLVGANYDPCRQLWNHIAKLPETNASRTKFEQFLYERGLVPQTLLYHEEPENENIEQTERGYYRCTLKQPLDIKFPAYAGWIRIPSEDKEYIAPWRVLAENEEEAIRLSLEAQNRCYPLPAELLECEQIDTFNAHKSQVVIQECRYKPAS
ncbi:MAG: hypothetical protein LBU65_07000 [Planctomycetaceae bacterium]|jgi:hypothetical protein|nr:hypothetical protein [Planctomycetaceae bacterium]